MVVGHPLDTVKVFKTSGMILLLFKTSGMILLLRLLLLSEANICCGLSLSRKTRLRPGYPSCMKMVSLWLHLGNGHAKHLVLKDLQTPLFWKLLNLERGERQNGEEC